MNAWDKLENESAKQYTAFCDYRDMGTGRSLRALISEYSQQTDNKPPTKRLRTIADWSSTLNWDKRCKMWDNHLSAAQTQSKENAIQELLDGELRDYKLQLDKWIDAYRRTPLHERQHTTVADDGSVTQFVKLNHDDLHRMAKWRDDIAKQGRRALGLPDKVTEKHIDHTSKGEKIEGITDDERLNRIAALLDTARDRRDRESGE